MVLQPGSEHKHDVRKVKPLSRLCLLTPLFLCAVANSGLVLCLNVLVDALY